MVLIRYLLIALLAAGLAVEAKTIVTIQVIPDAVEPPPVEPPVEPPTKPPVEPPVIPPVEPPPVEPPPPDSPYTRLGPIPVVDRFADQPMPYYATPEDGWRMILDQCGPIGTWDHEIEMVYGQEYDLRVKNLPGCVHVKGIPGPNGELPEFSLGLTTSMRFLADKRPGGLFVEDIKTSSIGVPNNRDFLVVHRAHLSNWGDHAIITSTGAKHLYFEFLDSYAGYGANNHALYIDNVAYANIQRNTIESPGRGHALRVIAQGSTIRGNKICNIQCDGSILHHEAKNRDLIGMAPLEFYVNGEHLVEDNDVVYYHKENVTPHATGFRHRPAIQSLDRYRKPGDDHFTPLVMQTAEYNDPQTWIDMPAIETTVKDLRIECLGFPPCYGINVSSTYPRTEIWVRDMLVTWWYKNKFPTWELLLQHADPSWHPTLDLMKLSTRERRMERHGSGMVAGIPIAVPAGWRQKARITLENVTGNFDELARPQEGGNWCLGGRVQGDECVEPQSYYNQAEIIIK